MADLTRPRPQNGDGPERVTTPRMIMRARLEREEKRAQIEAERREQEETERKRRSDERKAAAAAAGQANAGVAERVRAPPGEERKRGPPRATVEEVADESDRRRSQRRSGAPEAVSSQPYGAIPAESQIPDTYRRRPAGESSVPAPGSGGNSRARNTAASESQQPRPVRVSSAQQGTAQRGSIGTGTNNRAQGEIPTTAYARNPAAPQSSNNQPKNGTTSSFPHAFERWEQLSAHWEGLTSYWIKRLEGNSDEIANQPINQQLARQVTDLSHAGANLFHAVVQLQRLRASSERKFQRWFFETRTEQERTQEKIAQLEGQLQEAHEGRSKDLRNEARVESDRLQVEQALEVRRLAEAQLKEMKRELQISRDEARRSWEEIGRMEQAERDRTLSLKRGQPTLVGGVQVVPMLQSGHSRQTSSNSREAGGGSYDRDPREEGYEPARSDTDTDPYVDSGRRAGIPPVPQIPSTVAQSSHISGATSNAASHPGRSAPTTQAPTSAPSGSGHEAYDRGGYTSAPQPFYQQTGAATALHGHGPEQGLPPTLEAGDDALSEEEYAYDSQGEIQRDIHGNAIIFRRRERDRERDYVDEYGHVQPRYSAREPEVVPDPVAPAVGGAGGYPGTSNGHHAFYPPPPTADYVWEVSRHQHPTRLSDVLEEDERSRTSPSRTSERSRGIQ